MGFWKTFFADTKCRNCGSYDLRELPINSRTINLFETIYNFYTPLKKVYECNECGQYVFIDKNDKKYWTKPKHGYDE